MRTRVGRADLARAVIHLSPSTPLWLRRFTVYATQPEFMLSNQRLKFVDERFLRTVHQNFINLVPRDCVTIDPMFGLWPRLLYDNVVFDEALAPFMTPTFVPLDAMFVHALYDVCGWFNVKRKVMRLATVDGRVSGLMLQFVLREIVSFETIVGVNDGKTYASVRNVRR